MSDLISRQAAIDVIKKDRDASDMPKMWYQGVDYAINHLIHLPSAQPEVKAISYQDCQNALLKMWMDNVVTDGEYYRIVERLNAKMEEQNGVR